MKKEENNKAKNNFSKILMNLEELDFKVKKIEYDTTIGGYKTYCADGCYQNSNLTFFYQYYTNWNINSDQEPTWRLWAGLYLTRSQYAELDNHRNYKSIPELYIDQDDERTCNVKLTKHKGIFSKLLKEKFKKYRTHWIGTYLLKANPKKLEQKEILKLGEIIHEFNNIINKLKKDKTIEFSYNDLMDTFEKEVEKSIKDSSSNRQKRLRKAFKKPSKTTCNISIFKRNQDVAAEVLLRAKGICEECNQEAPFIRKSDRSPYLEVHHKITLANGGEDTVENAVAICPNCHRKAHHG